MAGYDAMLDRLEPTLIICYGLPFPEMTGNLAIFPYRYFHGRTA